MKIGKTYNPKVLTRENFFQDDVFLVHIPRYLKLGSKSRMYIPVIPRSSGN